MGTEVTQEEIFERIDVRPPYYALRDVTRADGGAVTARITATQARGMEIGPIAASDAARHMAIAASVSAGLANEEPGRHMYLAYDAEFRRSRQRPDEEATEFTVTANHTYLDPGTVQASVALRTLDGAPVNSLSVYFMVLKHSDFNFFFADHQQAEIETDHDPYLDTVGLSEIEIDGNRLRATLGELDPMNCLGHFDGLPAMPVAYLMGNVVSANGTLLKHVLNADTLQFAIREGSVRADALAFAGERVDLEVEYQRYSGGTYWLHAKAVVGNEKTVGALHAKLRVREEPTAG